MVLFAKALMYVENTLIFDTVSILCMASEC